MSSPLLGAVSQGSPKSEILGLNLRLKFWQFDREYVENVLSYSLVSIRAQRQLDESVLKL